MELNQRWQLFEAERNLSGIRIAMAGRPLLNLFGGKKITIILKKKKKNKTKQMLADSALVATRLTPAAIG